MARGRFQFQPGAGAVCQQGLCLRAEFRSECGGAALPQLWLHRQRPGFADAQQRTGHHAGLGAHGCGAVGQFSGDHARQAVSRALSPAGAPQDHRARFAEPLGGLARFAHRCAHGRLLVFLSRAEFLGAPVELRHGSRGVVRPRFHAGRGGRGLRANPDRRTREEQHELGAELPLQTQRPGLAVAGGRRVLRRDQPLCEQGIFPEQQRVLPECHRALRAADDRSSPGGVRQGCDRHARRRSLQPRQLQPRESLRADLQEHGRRALAQRFPETRLRLRGAHFREARRRSARGEPRPEAADVCDQLHRGGSHDAHGG